MTSRDDPLAADEASLPIKGGCSCGVDPFSSLPADMHPKPTPRKVGLRRIRCPACGLEYWTNRPQDLCLRCDRGGDVDSR